MRTPVFQLLMMAVFVRRGRACKAGWVNAGFMRRAATLVWASGFLLANGSLGGMSADVSIASDDLVMGGLEKAQRADIAQLHQQLGNWLDYWSARYPEDTLEQAMLNLMVRLVKAKRGWVEEKGRTPFPFGQAITAASAGKLEQYIEGKV